MALEADHDSAPQNRALQKRLAKELTTMVHSEQDYLNSVEASGILFGQDTADQLKNLEEKLLLEIMDGVPQMTVAKNDLQAGVGIVDLLAEKTNIFPSKGEAKKMVMAGGVSINKVKVADTNVSVTTTDLLRDKYLILQKGKKQYYLLTAI